MSDLRSTGFEDEEFIVVDPDGADGDNVLRGFSLVGHSLTEINMAALYRARLPPVGSVSSLSSLSTTTTSNEDQVQVEVVVETEEEAEDEDEEGDESETPALPSEINYTLTRTHKHMVLCGYSVILFTIVPLLVLCLDGVYLAHLTWTTWTHGDLEPPDHPYWDWELAFLIMETFTGLGMIGFMLVIIILGIRLHRNVILAMLVSLLGVIAASSIWSYLESGHSHTWFPNSTRLPSYVRNSGWLTSWRYVELKLTEIGSISVMILVWIWNWEEILELHGTRTVSPAVPESPRAIDTPSRIPNMPPPPSISRDPYCVSSPVQDDQEQALSASPKGLGHSGIKLTGTGFEGPPADEEKNQTEFREDGDRPGVAQPSKVIHIQIC